MYIIDYVKGLVSGLVEELSEITELNLTINLNFNVPVASAPGVPGPGVEAPVAPPVTPPVVDGPPEDERNFAVGYAQAKPDKPFVNLWKKVGQNQTPVANGGPGLILEHPPIGPEREQVPDADKVVYVNYAYLADGGGICYEVVGFGSDEEIAKKSLDGFGYYIKDSELE